MNNNTQPRLALCLALAALAAGGAVVATRAHAQQHNQQAAATPNLSGTYVSTWGAGQSIVTLNHTGQFVVGTFTNPGNIAPGALAGVVRGNTVTGRWTDPGSTGGFVLAFSADGRSFNGTWGRTPDSNNSGGAWTGQRQ